MSPEERRLLTDLFDRVRGAAETPRDREAEDLIAQKLLEQPYATYFLAQAVIIQDHALQATANRVRELEDEVQRLESQTAAQPQSAGFLGSLGSLFGNQPSPGTRDRDAYAQREGRLYDDYARTNREPEPAPSPWGRSGAASPWAQPAMSSSGGFLSGALTTAAGVAGGVLAADAIRDLFSSNVGGTANPANGLLGNAGNTPVGETVVNNFFGNDDKSDNRDDKSDSRDDRSDSRDEQSNDRDDVRQVDDSSDDDDFDVADFGGGDDDSFA